MSKRVKRVIDDEAEALEADITEGRPGDPVREKTRLIGMMEEENIPVPNNANKLTVGELEQKLEAGRFRKRNAELDQLVKEPELVDDDMYSGGYVKQYAAGGSVRKANFMDD